MTAVYPAHARRRCVAFYVETRWKSSVVVRLSHEPCEADANAPHIQRAAPAGACLPSRSRVCKTTVRLSAPRAVSRPRCGVIHPFIPQMTAFPRELLRVAHVYCSGLVLWDAWQKYGSVFFLFQEKSTVLDCADYTSAGTGVKCRHWGPDLARQMILSGPLFLAKIHNCKLSLILVMLGYWNFFFWGGGTHQKTLLKINGNHGNYFP